MRILITVILVVVIIGIKVIAVIGFGVQETIREQDVWMRFSNPREKPQSKQWGPGCKGFSV